MKKLHLIGLSLLSAVLLSLAWPSNGFAPLIFIAFVPLFFVHDFIVNQETKTRKLSVFRMVYLSLFVWNVLTTWWIWNSTGIGAAAAIILNTLFMTTTFWLYQTTRKKLFGNKGGMYLLVFFWLSMQEPIRKVLGSLTM
jgi:apolipoprotein N-acyltransferase